MKTAILRYTVIIRKEAKHYVAYVPTLGISDFGSSVDEAKRHVQGAIECHIEGLIKTGTDVPAPDTGDFYVSQSEITVSDNIKFAF